MHAPVAASGANPGEWLGPFAPPSAYACLSGPGGFTSYVSTRQCVLGRVGAMARATARSVGFDDVLGLRCGDVDVDLGDDRSIARCVYVYAM